MTVVNDHLTAVADSDKAAIAKADVPQAWFRFQIEPSPMDAVGGFPDDPFVADCHKPVVRENHAIKIISSITIAQHKRAGALPPRKNGARAADNDKEALSIRGVVKRFDQALVA